jgi:dephospho-CoA kinase
MLKAGLTGGYASGKSFVASELERRGCLVIYADRLGHATLEPTGEAYAPVIEAFGHEILQPDHSINRKKLGALVFAAPERLAQLNSFVHPAVFRLEEQMLSDFAAQHPKGVAVIEAAILIETGRHTFFDRLIVTHCAVDTQIARGMKRDGLTREEVLARLARQMPSAEKANFAHYLIDTNGTKQNTLRQVDVMWQELRTLAEQDPA